jgi:hypothetical protein
MPVCGHPSATLLRCCLCLRFTARSDQVKKFGEYESSLRRMSGSSWFLRSRVRIPQRTQLCASCVCCVCSGLCDELITCSEESYRGCVSVWSLNMKIEAFWALSGLLCQRRHWGSFIRKSVKDVFRPSHLFPKIGIGIVIHHAGSLAKCRGVCYNERFLSVNSGWYNENRCYNERS